MQAALREQYTSHQEGLDEGQVPSARGIVQRALAGSVRGGMARARLQQGCGHIQVAVHGGQHELQARERERKIISFRI